MLITYTLYLRGDAVPPGAFEPVMCESTGEVMDRAHQILALNPDCDLIEVYFGDRELFQVKRDRKAGLS